MVILKSAKKYDHRTTVLAIFVPLCFDALCPDKSVNYLILFQNFCAFKSYVLVCEVFI